MEGLLLLLLRLLLALGRREQLFALDRELLRLELLPLLGLLDRLADLQELRHIENLSVLLFLFYQLRDLLHCVV